MVESKRVALQPVSNVQLGWAERLTAAKLRRQSSLWRDRQLATLRVGLSRLVRPQSKGRAQECLS